MESMQNQDVSQPELFNKPPMVGPDQPGGDASATPVSSSVLNVDLGYRIVICEDHDVTRIGFREICRKIGCQVVAETDTGAQAIEYVEDYKPDMLILDLFLHGDMSGQMVHAEIKKRGLSTKIFVVTSYCDSASFFDWINQPDGPDGVLEKDSSAYELRTGFVQVLTSGPKYIPERIWHKESGTGSNPLNKLSLREMEVLRDVAQGLRLVDIAKKRKLSPLTVRTYMNDIYTKLGLPVHSLQAAGAEYNKWIGMSGMTSMTGMRSTR